MREPSLKYCQHCNAANHVGQKKCVTCGKRFLKTKTQRVPIASHYEHVARFLAVTGTIVQARKAVISAKELCGEDAAIKFAIQVGGFERGLDVLNELGPEQTTPVNRLVGVNGHLG